MAAKVEAASAASVAMSGERAAEAEARADAAVARAEQLDEALRDAERRVEEAAEAAERARADGRAESSRALAAEARVTELEARLFSAKQGLAAAAGTTRLAVEQQAELERLEDDLASFEAEAVAEVRAAEERAEALVAKAEAEARATTEAALRDLDAAKESLKTGARLAKEMEELQQKLSAVTRERDALKRAGSTIASAQTAGGAPATEDAAEDAAVQPSAGVDSASSPSREQEKVIELQLLQAKQELTLLRQLAPSLSPEALAQETQASPPLPEQQRRAFGQPAASSPSPSPPPQLDASTVNVVLLRSVEATVGAVNSAVAIETTAEGGTESSAAVREAAWADARAALEVCRRAAAVAAKSDNDEVGAAAIDRIIAELEAVISARSPRGSP